MPLIYFSFLLLLCSGALAAPDWKIIDVAYPTTDVVVAGYNVLDFGAKADGKTDCTDAFQDALDKISAAGGGTVFVPSGHYAFKGTLSIPTSVVLRGEWKAPSFADPVVRGTILMPYAGKGNEEGAAFISVGTSAGIKDLSIWYPEQNATSPVPYPFSLEQVGMNNATFENLTLVNPYLGIKVGPKANELHYVHNVYGTPLKTGIRYDSTTDIGRLEQIDFAPYFWSGSGLPRSPSESVLVQWLRGNATGIHMLRSDWEYVDRVTINSYQTGFKSTQGARGAANAQFRRLILSNCVTALYVEKTNPYGMVFTQCYFGGSDYGVHLSKEFDSVVLFSNCILLSSKAVLSEGTGVIMMEQCRIDSGDISLDLGTFSMAASSLMNSESRIKIGPDVTGVVLAGNTFAAGNSTVQSRAKREVVQISDEPINVMKLPNYSNRPEHNYRPRGSDFKALKPSGRDDTEQIQSAIDSVRRFGGGIVFLAGGDYILEGNLIIPEGVELRGVHDVPHHTMAAGSVLHVYPKNTSPAITMLARSGMRGLSFNYPLQKIEQLTEDPFLIQGQGEDIYIINVNAANPYRFLDLMTYRCDNHYVDYLSGSPLKVGVLIGGGSINGELRNLQFNPHYWSRTPGRNTYYKNRPDGGVSSGGGKLLWEFQKENLDALAIGDTVDQFLYQNFVFGSLYGIRFTKETGVGPKNLISHGHGTDGSKVGVFFEHGDEQITMINSELVAMSSTNKTGIKVGPEFNAVAVMINTMVWGSPDLLSEVDNGTLILQNLTATRHGEGILVRNGRVYGTNLNFLHTQGMHLQADGRDKGKFTGVIVRKKLSLSHSSRNTPIDLYVERK